MPSAPDPADRLAAGLADGTADGPAERPLASAAASQEPAAASDPAAAARLAPIVPLSAARRRRELLRRPPPAQSPEPPAPGDGDPGDAPGGRDGLQRAALQDAVASGRLGTADLFAMVRLGILTDDVSMLPCADRHRRENALDWERLYLEARGQLPEGQPTPSQVGCPIMAQAASAAPPACVEALRHRAHIPVYSPPGGFARKGLDDGDPVVRSELRPCLLLSRELFRHLLLPLWEKEPC